MASSEQETGSFLCLQTEDLELKKLVYLYLINYAKTQPDLAIMGVNTFVKVRHTRPATELNVAAGQNCLTGVVPGCRTRKTPTR